MENLDLFTPVEQGLPTVTDCNYYCRYSSGLYRSGYFGHQGRFSEGQHPGEVTHWLDLSKLTTKQKAEEAIYKAYSMPNRPFDDYQIPDLDKLYESL